ncbi:hypothetical protein RBB78_04610 [Tunturiibacter empetritectus]|uniref:hypothetical protein n=1 Tax=Tunturiibacter empetritectus TaxID=3069691 RepID=UPI003D9AEFEC
MRDNATGTITLSQPSLSGPVVVTMLNGSTFANVPATVTIPQGVASQSFVITTPNIPIPFKTAICSIYAMYGSSSASAVLLVASRVIAPIMSSLTVFPTTVTIGEISRGTVTLVEAVPMPAVIALEAMDPTVGPGVRCRCRARSHRLRACLLRLRFRRGRLWGFLISRRMELFLRARIIL